MRKVLLLSVIVLFMLSSVMSYGQTAADVLNKMIEVQGGKKNLEGVKDSLISGSMQMPQMGFSGTLIIQWKAPNLRRMDFEITAMGLKITQLYDGEKVWQISSQTGAPQEMPETFATPFKRQAIGDDALVNPEKYGIKYTLKGKETVDGNEYFVLVQTFPDGYASTSYIDPKTYLTYKVTAKSPTQMGGEVDTESFYSDYKKVDGRMLPHSIKTLQAGQEYVIITIDKVKYNSGLEDSLFKLQQ
jgi:outer membrane lipoprotein-sorting protein